MSTCIKTMSYFNQVLLWATVCCLSVGTTFAQDHVSNTPFDGPVSFVLQGMANKTAEATETIVQQLESKFQEISELLSGNIEVISTAAMQQMADVLLDATTKLSSENCTKTWTIEELYHRIDAQLQNCTQPIAQLKDSFELESFPIASTIETSMVQISNLMDICFYPDSMSSVAAPFSTGTTCFVQQLGSLNQLIATQVNDANLVILHTRKLSASTVDAAKQCSDQAVAEVQQLLAITLQDC